jgi:uncharacterized protein
MIGRLYDRITRCRLLLIVIFLALTILFTYKSTSFVLHDDPNRWPPKDNPNVQLNDSMQENFGGANLVTIQVTVKKGDIFNTATLTKVKRITDELGLVWGVIPCNVLSIGAIRVRYLKATEDLLVNIPLMETIPHTEQEMAQVKRGVYDNPLTYGTLVSTDSTSTIILADFRTSQPEGSKIKLPATDPVTIYKEIKRIIGPENDDNHTVRAVGTPIIVGWVNSEGLPYILAAFVVFSLGIAVVLYLSLRKRRAVLLSLAMAIGATIWAFGLYAIFVGTTLLSSSAFLAPFIIMATITCHSVQFFRRYLKEEYVGTRDPNTAIRNTVVALSKPIVISLLADCASFLILAIVPFDNVSVLGVVTSFGFISTIVLIYLFLIPLISMFPGKPIITGEEAEEKITRLDRWIDNAVTALIMPTKARVITMMVVLALTGMAVYRISALKTGQDNTYAIHNLMTKSWKTNSIYLMEQDFKEKFKGVYPLSILIKTKEEGGLLKPANLKKIDAFSSYMEKVPGVAGCSSLPVFFKLMHWFTNGGGKEFWAIPDDKKVIGFYHNQLVGTEPGSFDGVVDYEVQSCPLYAYVGDTSRETVERVFTAAQTYARDQFNDDQITAQVGGGTIGIAKAFNDNIRKWLIISTVLSAVATFIIVVVILRTVVGGLLLLLPLLVGSALWLWIISALGIEMNSNTVSSMAIAMGIGIDAEIYFLYRFREEFSKVTDFRQALIQGFSKIRKGLIFSHLALIVGLWILTPIPLYIGYMGFCMGLIILICFVMSFVISPVLWSALKPKFLFK